MTNNLFKSTAETLLVYEFSTIYCHRKSIVENHKYLNILILKLCVARHPFWFYGIGELRRWSLEHTPIAPITDISVQWTNVHQSGQFSGGSFDRLMPVDLQRPPISRFRFRCVCLWYHTSAYSTIWTGLLVWWM